LWNIEHELIKEIYGGVTDMRSVESGKGTLKVLANGSKG
jgi:hypothetical protein